MSGSKDGSVVKESDSEGDAPRARKNAKIKPSGKGGVWIKK